MQRKSQKNMEHQFKTLEIKQKATCCIVDFHVETDTAQNDNSLLSDAPLLAPY